MWSIEDIKALNPSEPTQTRSFLQHVLDIGAASEELLCSAAHRLEELGTPHVIGFAQLPFRVWCSDEVFRVPGWRDSISVELSLNPVTVSVDHTGRLRYQLSDAVEPYLVSAQRAHLDAQGSGV